ncbi:hypothetical protein EDB85DRAFT_2296555 [Lactarius pseudohatsudake]|nr:hypothetical protein EDB85DRAFT_2296555 [Lactarius pseudohatsudake]
MRKLARVASIVVNISKTYGKHNLKRKTRELEKIERVLEKCSKKEGFKGLLLRRDLLTKMKQCDGELSNVLQTFQAELALDTRFALITERREVTANSGPVEAIWAIPQGPNGEY